MQDIFSRIKEEHRGLLATLGRLSNRFDNEMFDDLKASLTIHMRAEEQTLYSSIEDKKKQMIERAKEAHNHVLALMDGLKRGDQYGFEAKVIDILAKLNDHIDDEEENIFPAAREILGDEEVIRLSNSLFEMERQAKIEGHLK